ncbi:MAG: ABC transporter ATP-binding protein [Chloroherpetonaceae bacterium]|nr:ABC transporter ATP-binding protein [Chloroherpetonaceae bacterium]
MSVNTIEVENISKKFLIGKSNSRSLREAWSNLFSLKSSKSTKEEFWALKDINFSIKQGESVALIGKNGSGKSTLLKILSRILRPTTGKFSIKGKLISLLEVGTGFHNELTGRENIFLNGSILGMSKPELEKRFDQIVDFSGVEKFIDTPVKRYSSGMYVRLAFSVAVHLDPEIFIIDEVLAVGDAEFQRKCKAKLKEITLTEGKTVLFVGHRISLMQALTRRGFLLESGRLVFDGNIDDTINHYVQRGYIDSAFPEINFSIDESKKAQMLKISLLSQVQVPSINFDVFEPITLKIEYILREKFLFSRLLFDLERNGTILYRSYDTDTGDYSPKERAPGIYTSYVTLVNPKKAGEYIFNKIGIVGIDETELHVERNILRFEVHQDEKRDFLHSYAKNRVGEIFTKLDWKTKKIY